MEIFPKFWSWDSGPGYSIKFLAPGVARAALQTAFQVLSLKVDPLLFKVP